MSQSTSPPDLPGYEVIEQLGTGSSATVWRARRLADALPVALKVLPQRGGDIGPGLAEAGVLARVRHPHVLRLHDVLPLHDPSTGRPTAVVLAMQLATGGSLGQVLSRRHLLSPGELVTVLHPVAAALADLHASGVVHGDLSCGNILFLSDGMPLLADLGTARVVGEERGAAYGTRAEEGMVAPEVVEGFAPDREADVYQLGAIAWLSLVGEPPGPTWLPGPEEGLAGLAPELPARLVELVEACLSPEPGDRPDAEEVAATMLEVAAPEPVEVAPDADPAQGLTHRLRQQARVDTELAQPPRPARRWLPQPRVPGQHRQEGETLGQRLRGRAGAAAALAGVVALAVLVITVVVGPARMGALIGFRGAQDGSASTLGATSDQVGEGEPVAAVQGAAATGSKEGDPDQLGAPEDSPAEARPPTDSPVGAGGPGESVAPAGTVMPAPAVTVQELVDARATAWERGDPELLTGVVAADSPAHELEVQQLSQARETGLVYPRVHFDVLDAQLEEVEVDRVVVRATVSRDALEARAGDGGGAVLRSPPRVDEVRLVLVREDEGWRFWSWE